MADEQVNIQVTDGGSIEEIASLLETMGLTGEEALQRLESGFINLSQSMQTADAQQRLFGVGVQAGLTDTTNLARAIDALTTSEAEAAGTAGNLAKLLASLGGSEQSAADAARQLAAAMQQAGTAAQTAGAQLQTVGSAATGGQNAVNNFRSAIANGTTSFVTAGGAANTAALSFSQVARNAQSAIGPLTSLVASFAAFAGTQALETAADNVLNLQNRLQGLGISGAQLRTTFDQLYTISDQTGIGINIVADAFSKFEVAGANAGKSVAQSTQALQSFALIARETGLTSQQAGAALGQFATQLAQGGLSAQNLARDFQQYPALLNVLDQTFGVNAESVSRSQLAQDRLSASIQLTQAKQQAAGQTTAQTGLAYDESSLKIYNLGQQYDKTNVHMANLQSTAGLTGNALTKQQNAIAAAQSQLYSYAAQIDIASQRQLTGGKAATVQATATLALKEQLLGVSQALSAGGVIDDLDKLNAVALLNANTFGVTFQAAFNILSNAVDKFVENSTGAQVVLGIIKNSIVELAGNIGPAIIAATALGAAIALIITVNTIQAFVNAGLAIKDLIGYILAQTVALIDGAIAWAAYGVAVALANLPVTVCIIGFGALAAAIALLVYSIHNGAVPSLSDMTNAIKTGATAAVKGLSDLVVNSANPALAALSGQFGLATGTSGQAANGASGLAAQLGGVAAQANKATSALEGYNNLQNKSGQASTINYLTGGGGSVLDSPNGGSAPAVTSFGSNTPASIPVSNQDPTASSRNGSSFRVAGGGGVDSVPIFVSPGEVVSIQTPSQHRAGVIPSSLPGTTKFANGGVFSPTTSFGVDLGTNVQTALQSASGGGSVTGFSPDQITAVQATQDNTTATEANTSALADTTAATSTAAAATTVANDNIQTVGGSITDGSTSTSSTDSSATSTVAGTSTPTTYTGAGAGVTGAGFGTTATGETAATPVSTSITSVSYGTPTQQGVVENGKFIPAGYLIPQAGGGSTYMPNRDGGDMLVGGSGGVDSQLMSLAVSPGESVHVRTPQQRQAAASSGSGGASVHNVFNITSPDVKSFGQSRTQIATNMHRSSRNAGRRVAGT